MPDVFDAQEIEKPKGEESKSKVFKKFEGEKNSNPFAAFAILPDPLHFETQETGEKIILLLRQHPVVLIPSFLILMMMLFAPALFEVVPVMYYLPDRFQIMTIVLWYLFTLAFALERFLDWYFNVYIVTDERIVDIDFYGLIQRDLTVAKIDNIEEVNFTQGGAFASIFNYGDVFIQTAAESRMFDFLKVPKPARVVEIIYELMQEEEQEKLEGRTK